MKVNEIFHSIQGESSFAGLPCAFIRLSGCDLRCSYCDTRYAYSEGREMSLAEVLRAIDPFPTRLALVTGGEPLLQPAVHGLFRALLERDYTVCLETGGHLPLGNVDPRVHKIMDLKCPTSGVADRNHFENIRFLNRADEVKFVVGSRGDFEWACDRIREFNLVACAGAVLVSPVHGQLAPQQLARWVLDSGLYIRMQIQLHRIIWPGSERGV